MRTFQGVVDAMQDSAARWEPTNDDGQVAAQEMRVLVRELPEVLEAFAVGMRSMAEKCTDSIWMDAGTAELLAGMAEYLTRPIDSLKDSAEAMDRPHADDIERMHRDDQRAAAWDWSRNQGYQV